MAFEQISDQDICDKGVRKAAETLVIASAWGSSYPIEVPFIDPTGTIVGVRMTASKSGSVANNVGLGIHQAESCEAQRSSGAHAGSDGQTSRSPVRLQ